MRRLTAWVGGIASAVLAYRFWRRRRAADTGAEPAADADARADELRTKLAESRTAEPAVEEPPVDPNEPAPEQAAAEAAGPESPAESPEERRRRVHAEGRAAIGEMDSERPS
jgi:hypothetical protein